MAGGPVAYSSAIPLQESKAFESIYDGAGTHEDRELMLFIADATTVDADEALWVLKFQMPEVVPTGTAKLRSRIRANATSGVLGLNIQWKSVGPNESPDDIAYSDEASWDITVPSTADQSKTQTLDLNADTVVAGETVYVLVEVDDSAHTVAVDVGCDFDIIWE